MEIFGSNYPFSIVSTALDSTSVRWTGHLSAMRNSAACCSSDRSPCSRMVRSEDVDLARVLVAIFAVFQVLSIVPDIDRDMGQRDRFAARIEPDGHRAAGAKTRRQEFIRVGSGIHAPDFHRFICEQLVARTNENVLPESRRVMFADAHDAGGD